MTWSKKAAIERMNSNQELQNIMQLEPGLKSVIEEAQAQRNVKGYNRIRQYTELKGKIAFFVGNLATKENLRSTEVYEVVRNTIDDLLPPDSADLYPDGKTK
jgi:hypothetical protein